MTFEQLQKEQKITSGYISNFTTNTEYFATAADASLNTEAAARSLNFQSTQVQIPITGVNCTLAGSAYREVEFELRSLHDKTFSMKLGALTVPRLTSLVPQIPITVKRRPHLAGLPLDYSDFASPGEINLLINAQTTGHLPLDESPKGSLEEPVARLRWSERLQ